MLAATRLCSRPGIHKGNIAMVRFSVNPKIAVSTLPRDSQEHGVIYLSPNPCTRSKCVRKRKRLVRIVARQLHVTLGNKRLNNALKYCIDLKEISINDPTG